MEEDKPTDIDDFSGGVQRRVSIFQQRSNELANSLNATFTTVIGAVSKRLGLSQKGSDLTSTTSTSTSTSTTTTSTSTSSSTSTSTTSTSTSTSTTTTA